jgi:hypothetical protein
MPQRTSVNIRKANKAAAAVKAVLDTKSIAKHMAARSKRTLLAAVRVLKAQAVAIRLSKKP